MLLLAACAEGSTHALVEPSVAARAFALLDADGSGRVSQSEVFAMAAKQGLTHAQMLQEFKQIDRNGDGEIEPEEISAKLGLVAEATVGRSGKLEPAKASEEAPAKTSGDSKAAKSKVPGPAVAKDLAPKEQLALLGASTDLTPLTPADISSVLETNITAPGSIPEVQYNHSKDSDAVRREVYTLSRKRVAELFSEKASQALRMRKAYEDQAAALEKKAKALWGNATVLLRQATKQTGETAANVAGRIMDENMPAIERLERTAKNSEDLAKSKHKIAEQTLHEAIKNQESTSKGVNVARKENGMPSANLLVIGSQRLP